MRRAAIMPGSYADRYRHKSIIQRVWFPIYSESLGAEGYSYGMREEDYAVYKTGKGTRPWVVHLRRKPVFRCWGNNKPFASYMTAIAAAAAVDRYELKGRIQDE